MNDIDLPESLITFLHEGRQLEKTAGSGMGLVTLYSLPDLCVENFTVQAYGSPWQDEDPNKEGLYRVPVVPLLKDSANYGDFVRLMLVWVPGERLFGSGDEEHGHLVVFPHASWEDIVADPIPYITWLEQTLGEDSDTGTYLRPWDKYPLHAD